MQHTKPSPVTLASHAGTGLNPGCFGLLQLLANTAMKQCKEAEAPGPLHSK